MKAPVTIPLTDIVGGSLCVSVEDGQVVFDKIAPLIQEGCPVELSFHGVDTVISAFLNAGIGQLYGEFTEDRIRNLVSVKDMARDDLDMLKRVVDNAKLYFANREKCDQAWQEEVGDE